MTRQASAKYDKKTKERLKKSLVKDPKSYRRRKKQKEGIWS